ncbi:MAG: hypothetical protein HY595_01155, partial [Candidatus Omnitrophica bacterium]|nr:hypothetical protein [Candidatus Omnitrophota bacterium]
MPELNERTVLYTPLMTAIQRTGWTLWVDGDGPNWISTDERGTWLLQTLSASPLAFSQLVSCYAEQDGLEIGKAWV